MSVHLDNDAKVMAPRDAMAPIRKVEQPPRRVAHTFG